MISSSSYRGWNIGYYVDELYVHRIKCITFKYIMHYANIIKLAREMHLIYCNFPIIFASFTFLVHSSTLSFQPLASHTAQQTTKYSQTKRKLQNTFILIRSNIYTQCKAPDVSIKHA